MSLLPMEMVSTTFLKLSVCLIILISVKQNFQFIQDTDEEFISKKTLNTNQNFGLLLPQIHPQEPTSLDSKHKAKLVSLISMVQSKF